MKTLRFAQVVAKSGRPEIHLAWSAPSTDPVLQKALKQHRVLTVHQQLRGGKKDFGVVGLDTGTDAQFLIFPKSLRAFANRRVVAIQYDLLEKAVSVGPVPRAKDRPKPTTVHKAPRASPPKQPKSAPTPSPEVETVAPAPRIIKPVEDDPTKSEIRIRQALADIGAGRIKKATSRLKSLLR